MRKVTTLILITLLAIKAYAYDFPKKIKDVLKAEYPGIKFKIDNSFILNNNVFLPLLPKDERKTEKIEISFKIEDENLPKLIWLSNDYAYVRLLNTEKNKKTILDLDEIPEQYKDRFLAMKFPEDLVVPEDLVISNDLSGLIGLLPIEKLKAETWIPGKKPDKVQIKKEEPNKTYIPILPSPASIKSIKGLLYLTSPDTGKIIFINLGNKSNINYIESIGMPWEIAHDNKNNLIYVTDLATDQIYELKPNNNVINNTIKLSAMSNPKDIKISTNSSGFYFVESSANFFTTFVPGNKNALIKKKIGLDPSNFAILEDMSLIAITHNSTNIISFLDTKDFSEIGTIKIDGGPDKIISHNARKTFFVTDRHKNKILEIDGLTRRIIKEISVDETPISLAIHPTKHLLYVGCGKENKVNIVDIDKGMVSGSIALPRETVFPSDLALSKDGNWLITTSEGSTTISIVNLDKNELTTTIDVGASTHAAVLIE